MEVVLYFISTIGMIVAAIILGSIILCKDTKQFHVKISWSGIEVSGLFFHNK